MNPGRKRWLPRVAVLLAVAAVLLVWGIWWRPQDRVIVENRSGESITLLEVRAGEESSTFHDVSAGAEVSAALRARVDKPFTVDGRLADGTRIRGSFRHPDGGGITGRQLNLVVLPGGQIVPRQGEKTAR